MHKGFTCTRPGFTWRRERPTQLCYQMREDLSAEEVQRSAVRRSPAPPHSEDVFCLTRRWLRSENIAHVVLVLPHARLAQLRSLGPVQRKLATVQMTDARKRKLQDLAGHLEFLLEAWGLNSSFYRAATTVASSNRAPLAGSNRPTTPRASEAHLL